MVIESTAKTIDFRRLCALDDRNEGLNTWDLARLGLPRHPDFKDLEPLTKTKYICLEFMGTERQSRPFSSSSSFLEVTLCRTNLLMD